MTKRREIKDGQPPGSQTYFECLGWRALANGNGAGIVGSAMSERLRGALQHICGNVTVTCEYANNAAHEIW